MTVANECRTDHNLRQEIQRLQDQLAHSQEQIRDLEKQRVEYSRQEEALFENSFSAKLLIEIESGKIVDTNEIACQYYGFSKSELLTLNIDDIDTQPMSAAFVEMQNAQMHGRTLFSSRHRLADGQLRDVEVLPEPIEIQGKPCLLATIRDVTERNAENAQLRLLWYAVNQSNNSIFITDSLGNVEYVNHRVIELSGHTLSELQDMNLRNLQFGCTPEENYSDIWMTISAGNKWSGEIRNRKQNGDYYWERVSISPVKDSAGVVAHFVVISDDITEQKRSWEQLKQNENTLKRLQSLANVGDWTWDPKSNTVSWSDEMYRIFGLDPETFTGDLNDIIAQAIHPDDHEAVMASNQAVIEEQRPGEMEYRAIWPDGSIRYLWAHPDEPLLDQDGNVLALSGIVQDITTRKQTEKELREKLDELARWYEITLDRETRNLELKREVNELLRRLSEPIRYPTAEE